MIVTVPVNALTSIPLASKEASPSAILIVTFPDPESFKFERFSALALLMTTLPPLAISIVLASNFEASSVKVPL